MEQLLRSLEGFLPEPLTPGILSGILGTLLLLIVVALVGRGFWRRYQRRRFIFRFGVLWDKKHRPFCVICRTPLKNWSRHSGWKFERQQGRTLRLPTTYGAFDCPVCVKPVRLIDHDGYEISLEDALRELQPPTVEN